MLQPNVFVTVNMTQHVFVIVGIVEISADIHTFFIFLFLGCSTFLACRGVTFPIRLSSLRIVLNGEKTRERGNNYKSCQCSNAVLRRWERVTVGQTQNPKEIIYFVLKTKGDSKNLHLFERKQTNKQKKTV